jgi:hypothetical protein
MSYALSEQQCPPTPSESKKTFQGFFPANFLTKNSEETTGPKGRRVRDRFAVSTWEPRSGS